jgi:hypothetical protein
MVKSCWKKSEHLERRWGEGGEKVGSRKEKGEDGSIPW